jgi:hypothetical protein
LNPRAATNDLLPFQGSPFNLLGTSAWLNLDSYSIYIRRQIIKTRLQRRGWDSNPRALADKRFSRPPRYDHFDTSPNALFHFTEVSTFCQVFFYFFKILISEFCVSLAFSATTRLVYHVIRQMSTLFLTFFRSIFFAG